MSAVVKIDLTRLAKVCALFNSNQMGERAAAHKANEILRAAGMTWPDMLHAERPDAGKFQSSRRRAVLTPGELLARYGNELTGWERGFLASLIRRPGRWTTRQSEVFAEICDRVAGGAV